MYRYSNPKAKSSSPAMPPSSSNSTMAMGGNSSSTRVGVADLGLLKKPYVAYDTAFSPEAAPGPEGAGGGFPWDDDNDDDT